MRKIEEKDLQKIVEWSNSAEAYGEYLTPEMVSAEEWAYYLKQGRFWNKRNRIFLIELRDGQPIGTIHYWLRQDMETTALVALKIAEPRYRNKGYGTEAQKYLIMYLLEKGGFSGVEMYTDINNRPQQRCLQKLGFEIVDSLTYPDRHLLRLGYLYRLTASRFARIPLYRYHYE